MHKADNYENILQARRLIEVARLAPSVHNTQPWYFELHGNALQLHVSAKRRLHAGDPTTRELWLSIGIMFETIVQAAEALGIIIKVSGLQTHSLKQPVAIIAISSATQVRSNKVALTTIRNRHTYRGELSDRLVEPSVAKSLEEIIKAHHLDDVEILATHDKSDIELASKLTSQGFRLAFSSTAFRRELSQLILPNWTQAHVGLPGAVLNKGPFGALWEKWSLWFNFGNTHKANTEANRVQKAPLLLFIATRGDVPSHWFDAGCAYALVTLELTRSNLLHSTIAAPIEAADLHEELEIALHTKLRLQCMLTVGHPIQSEKHPSTPRLTVDELLTIDLD